jgi:NAD(P)-dependent dehydrogenase (short-subunit alcohol dehydrogenase family)
MGLLDGKVAVVTGSGRGIGKEFALCMASEGAKVVINDVGVSLDGQGTDEDPAAQVCKEIEALGSEAVPNYDSVTDFEGAGRIVQTAVDAFGKIDILVNNAGIVRDRTLVKMSEDDFDAVVAVHMKGSCRLRYLSEGAVLGTRAFVTVQLEALRRKTGRSSPTGPYSLSGPDDSNEITALRKLRLRIADHNV